MSDQHQGVIAVSYRGSTRLSQTGTLEEVFAAIQQLLPVDKVYSVIQTPEGYLHKEIGSLYIGFSLKDEVPQKVVREVVKTPPASAPPVPPAEPKPVVSTVAKTGGASDPHARQKRIPQAKFDDHIEIIPDNGAAAGNTSLTVGMPPARIKKRKAAYAKAAAEGIPLPK